MARKLPPLAWFRAFEAAARHLSFTAAAQELGLTQSAVSQQIRSLELRLGVALFLRRPRGLALTDDGRKLQPDVDRALDTLTLAAERFDTGPTSGQLTVAASISVVQWVLAPRLESFLATHPGLRVRILSTIWPDDFHSAIADVEIRFGSAKQVGAGAERLEPDGLIAVAAPGREGLLETGPRIEAVGASDGWRRWSAEAGRAPLDASLHVDSYGLALDLARHGAGVALTSALLAAAAIAAGEVVQAHPCSVASAEGYFLALASGSETAPAFAAWLREELGIAGTSA